MKTWVNHQHHQHAGQQEMYRGRLVDCHEVPDRLDHVLAELCKRPVGPQLQPDLPDTVLDQALARVHAPRYLELLAHAWADWVAMDPSNAERDALPSVWPLPRQHAFRSDIEPANVAARLGLYAFDAGTPLMAGTWNAARAGAACALQAATAVAQGERAAFALTRPPGHHAGADYYGGYCFLNNAAIAAQALRDQGVDKVAVLDIDYHHGNGTQDIFYERADVFTTSIHGDPRTEYPFYLGHADERGAGTGAGANLNLPLPRGSSVSTWLDTLERAMTAVQRQGAQALVVPMGLDTFEGDPISGFHLSSADYTAVGQALASLNLPTVFTFEGGYAVAEVGINAVNLLAGFEGRT